MPECQESVLKAPKTAALPAKNFQQKKSKPYNAPNTNQNFVVFRPLESVQETESHGNTLAENVYTHLPQ